MAAPISSAMLHARPETRTIGRCAIHLRHLIPSRRESSMRAAQQGSLTTRRNFLHHSVTLAGAATLPTGAAATPPNAAVRLAQAGALAGTAASAITVKSTRLVGSAINYAYAVKAGPWVFLNGHEAFDFERGL